MMGSFLTRGLLMIFGYAYPAYECFKTVEKNKPEIEQLRFWCQYWILVALLTVFERVGDTLVSWLPMYSEAKLALFIYLWYPKTKGTTYVYASFFRPYISKHEAEIDRNLFELKNKAGDIAVLYWQKAASYGQTRVFEILQYVASQSTARSTPPQQGVGSRQAPVRARQADATSQQLPPESDQAPQQPPSRTVSAGSIQKQQAPPSRTVSAGLSQLHQPPSQTSSSTGTPQQQETSLDTVASPARLAETTTSASQYLNQTKGEAMHIDESNGNTDSRPQEIVMEEVTRVTRARLRKNRAAATAAARS